MIKKITSMIIIGLVIVMLSFSGIVFGADIDLEGEEIHFWQWYGILSAFEEGGDYEGRLEELEAKYNFKMVQEEFPPNETEQFVARLMADDSTNDIWMVRAHNIPHLASEGIIMPIQDIISEDFYAEAPEMFGLVTEQISFMGKNYGFLHSLPYPHQNYFLGFRKDMFEREGLESPYDVYNEGNWNWDKFLEVAEELTQDTTGNEEIDQWGLATNPRDFWLFTNGIERIKEVDGRIEFALNESSSARTFEFARKVFKTGVFQPPAGKWRNGVAGMVVQTLSRIDNWSEDYEWGAVPLPKGPDVEHNQFVALPWALDVLVIPANSEYPEEKLQILSELWPPTEEVERMRSYIKDVAQDQEMAQILLEGFDYASVPKYIETEVMGRINRKNNPLGKAVSDIMSGNKTASEALNEIAPSAQEELDDLFN